MILEIDVGNSELKWRLLVAGAVSDRGKTAYREQQYLQALPAVDTVTRIRIASVAGDAWDKRLQAELGARYGRTAEFALVTPVCAGVRCAYAEPGLLGIDRWLAVVAAYQRLKQAVLVVDLGSALTIDLVDAGGVHLGGYIIPGQGLMRRALHDGTGRVRFDLHGDDQQTAAGVSTAEAVQRGTNLALLGAVKLAIDLASQRLTTAPAVMLTGGGGEWLAASLAGVVQHRPDLVFEGLAWVIP